MDETVRRRWEWTLSTERRQTAIDDVASLVTVTEPGRSAGDLLFVSPTVAELDAPAVIAPAPLRRSSLPHPVSLSRQRSIARGVERAVRSLKGSS